MLDFYVRSVSKDHPYNLVQLLAAEELAQLFCRFCGEQLNECTVTGFIRVMAEMVAWVCCRGRCRIRSAQRVPNWTKNWKPDVISDRTDRPEKRKSEIWEPTSRAQYV